MTIEKRSLSLSGHRTSVSLEPEFWAAFAAIAARRSMSLNALAREIDDARIATTQTPRNLSSTIRVYVLQHAQSAISE